MITISASAIKDFISCPNKVYFRSFKPIAQELNVDLHLGSIVHKVVENFPKYRKYEQGIEFAKSLIDAKFQGDSELSSKLETSLRNFYDNYFFIAEYTNKKEVPFEINTANFRLLGRFDVITVDNMVVDWKLTRNVPINISNDPQFIVYDYAYEKLNKQRASKIVNINLLHAKVVTYRRNNFYYNELFNSVIPAMTGMLKSGKFYRKGAFDNYNSLCRRCPYKTSCLSSSISYSGEK